MRSTLHRLAVSLLGAVCVLSLPAYASSTIYFDVTYNLADYGSPQIYSSDPSVTTVIQQLTSGGNPGDALSFQTTFNGAAAEYYTMQGLLKQILELRSRHARRTGLDLLWGRQIR